MILIYPSDPSTLFLSPIADAITHVLTGDIDKVLPEAFEETISNIRSTSIDSTILFLGHGYNGGLHGGCYVPDERIPFVKESQGKQIFKERKIILFSCMSADYIDSLSENYAVAIGFGNIVTATSDLKTKKDVFKYTNCIHVFRGSFIKIVTDTILEAHLKDFTYIDFFNSLKLRINRTICAYSLSSNTEEVLAGELLFDLKKHITLRGNGNLFIFK